MDDQELARAYAVARELARTATEEIARTLGHATGLRNKRDAADWVTATDEGVERVVRAQLQAAFPHHRVVGEEQGASGADDGAPVWYVDPVDGTANFVRGLPWVSFSLGLVADGEPVVGVIADPARGEVFHAVRGSGTYLNDTPVSTDREPGVTGNLVMTELAGNIAWWGLQTLAPWLGERHALLRVMGSSALTLATVATGRAAAVVLHAFAPWDVAAGTVLCREAGLAVVDGTGSDHGLPQNGLVAGHPDTVAQLWEVVHAQQ